MLVSIITIYYNREDYISESINSLLNQTYKNIEIIAVDDGSTDKTYEKLKAIQDPRLKVYTQKNKGFVNSLIDAIDKSSGEIIAIHGSGDISLPNRIQEQYNILNNNNNVGVVGCHVENINSITQEKRIYRPEIEPSENVTSKLMKKCFFTHGEVMFRRNIYDLVGGYRSFFKYTQDYDLWMRMSLHCDFSIVPQILYRRFILPDGVGVSFEKALMQKYFGEYSKQCVQLKIEGKKDYIEKFGDYGFFFRNKTKRLSDTLWRLSITAYFRDDLENAMYINSRSIQEKITSRNVITYLSYILLKKFKFLDKLSKSLMNSIKLKQISKS